MSKKASFRKIFLGLALILSLGPALVVTAPQRAEACDLCFTGVLTTELQEWISQGPESTYPRITMHVTSELTAQRVWWVSIFWEDNILPALMMMTDQLSAVAMQQMQIVGAMMDAKHQLETQQLLQKIAARTHKDYHPSVGLCEFGSGAKSLAASDRKAEINAVVLSQRSQDRALGAIHTAAAIGEDGDKETRVRQFREKFCDPSDNNNGLRFLCDHNQDNLPQPPIGAWNFADNVPAPERMNKDIDYVRTIDAPWTLDMDFISTTPDPFDGDIPAETLTNTEEEVIALANNLYGETVFVRPPSKSLENQPNQRITNMQKIYMDMRSVVAKRAVAENSFNAITAMKSEGSPGSRDYLLALMRELGVSPEEAEQMLGDNPSYYAQMEILTKKIYHNPDFYTNLYDKPANVERKGVALQAIALMQKFDLFKSYLRNEASLSVLLELAVIDLQGEVENEINQMTAEGTPAKR